MLATTEMPEAAIQDHHLKRQRTRLDQTEAGHRTPQGRERRMETRKRTKTKKRKIRRRTSKRKRKRRRKKIKKKKRTRRPRQLKRLKTNLSK
jgi:hypothetical protein